MVSVMQPWHVAFVWAVGWVNLQQNEVIEYLCAENRVLREQVGKKRILLTDHQRRRLAVKGKALAIAIVQTLLIDVQLELLRQVNPSSNDGANPCQVTTIRDLRVQP